MCAYIHYHKQRNLFGLDILKLKDTCVVIFIYLIN